MMTAIRTASTVCPAHTDAGGGEYPYENAVELSDEGTRNRTSVLTNDIVLAVLGEYVVGRFGVRL